MCILVHTVTYGAQICHFIQRKRPPTNEYSWLTKLAMAACVGIDTQPCLTWSRHTHTLFISHNNRWICAVSPGNPSHIVFSNIEEVNSSHYNKTVTKLDNWLCCWPDITNRSLSLSVLRCYIKLGKVPMKMIEHSTRELIQMMYLAGRPIIYYSSLI